MDRSIFWTTALLRAVDLLQSERNAMVAIGKVIEAVAGTSTVVSGLACTPTSPASMSVQIGEGQIWSQQQLDPTAFSSLPADTADLIMKQGLLMEAATLSCPAPTTVGYSINYLIEATFAEQDADPIVLSYFNSSNPSQPYSGPNNTGTSNYTQRQDLCQVQVKAGTAAPTGSQTTPAPDGGYVGLWVVTVAYGQTTITAANISPYANAPFINPLSTLITASQAAGVVGSMRNGSMLMSTASASATFTADEIIVEASLGGLRFCLANYSQTINLATTGAGGMDTGTAPVSGFVALYAIYNPTTKAASILATNATSAVAPSVYGGANMPAGYTASALISVWATNGSGLFAKGVQRDRKVFTGNVIMLSGAITQASYTLFSIANYVPPNARTWSGSCAYGSTVAGTLSYAFASDSSGTGSSSNQGSSTQAIGGALNEVPIATQQTTWYQANVSAGTPSIQVTLSSYTF